MDMQVGIVSMMPAMSSMTTSVMDGISFFI